ncbi:MAG TPA: slipin family protein [Candidatus Syntrophoarchaeum butanivorans]|uniref:Band 7 protein n=1 Tax=Candidatus Syntropharchaeum butanivorans TaxID=1839936 RepID=A0A1F2P6B4_9EURY|nr:MAG: Band 7 protein [Candidatus Syntrophoarchaeum butanivorans]RJS70497.1 MAG: slipin family protein [Candidatus Syntrophoarchaeum sp. WYZ-LMO15]HDM36268.1 slipin family protein [Candidatus Syntrophoarchaeum butanivorans]HEC56603.1 slipin family protein [Candidatus Syntrophoarchaeum butanivorans]
MAWELIFGILIILLIILASAVKVVKEYERGVIFRLGRLVGARGPGLFFIIPIFEMMVKVDLRTVTFDVPPQEVITKDNVTTKVNAVVYYRVMDPEKAVTQVENYALATSQIALTTLRGVIGQSELDELLAEREKINKKLQQIVDEATDPWGIKVSAVEIKDVELPKEMQRAMASQAEAERNRRARIIAAEGEYQAAQRLAEAAEILNKTKGAMFIRALEMIRDATEEKATTVVIPIPVEWMEAFGGGRE